MMRSLFSGVSGLKGHQSRMDVIGNNIANVNTTGFKSSRTVFADTLSQTMNDASSANSTRGGINPKQVGLGVGVSTVDMLFTDGTPTSTGKNTDLALSGNGLFVVKQGQETFYTRNGAFEFDEDGNYVMPGSGLYVQGWMANNGDISTNATPTNIQIQAGKAMPAKATDQINYAYNLDAAARVVTNIVNASGTAASDTSASADGPFTITFSDGNSITVKDGYYKEGNSEAITTTVTVYDSLGNSYNIPIYFTKTASTPSTSPTLAGNTWTVSLSQNPASTTAVTVTASDNTEATVSLGAANPLLYFSGTGTGVSVSPGTATLTVTNGANRESTVAIDFSQLTQYSNSSTINASANGNAMGNLKNITIDSSGVIVGVYTNGVRQNEAQVAIAQFTNSSGLLKTGNSLYQESNNSGAPNVKTAADLGVDITPSALEMSNVDIANEFSDMIVTQRGFQSNSKMVTVGDEMLETLINMKR